MKDKDTYYFSHDYNARSDQKIKKLLRSHGVQGYGVFWCIIEDLYQNANAMQLDIPGIAYDLRVDESLVTSVIHDFDLFIVEGDSFGSNSVQKRLDMRGERSAIMRENARKRWELKQNHSNGNANAMQEHSDSNAIKGKERKGKEIKGNERKDIDMSDGASAPTHSKDELVSMMVKRKGEFVKTVEPYRQIYGDKMVDEFIGYWTEPNKSETKFRRELEKTWDLERRMKTWAANQVNFKNYGKDRGSNRADERWEALGQLGSSIDLSGI